MVKRQSPSLSEIQYNSKTIKQEIRGELRNQAGLGEKVTPSEPGRRLLGVKGYFSVL